MNTNDYTPQELAEAYQISIQQAERYICRLGADREEMDRLLASSARVNRHRPGEIERSSTDISYGHV